MIMRALMTGTAILLAAFQWGCNGKAKAGNEGGKGRPGGAVSVHAISLTPQRLADEVKTTGNLLAWEEVELRPEASGKITRLLFDEGVKVKKGQLLVEINDSELRASLAAALPRLKLAEEKEARQKTLFERKVISQEQYDEAANAREVAEAQVALLRAQIAKMQIRAPFDGMVGIRSVSEGAYVTPSTEVASLQDLDRLKVDFTVPARYASRLNEGDTVIFRSQVLDSARIAVIKAVEPKVDPATQSVKIRAEYRNIRGDLVPGTFVEVTLALAPRMALMVPTGAVVPVLKGQEIYRYHGGKVESRRIETGVRTSGLVEVIQGISPGDTIVVDAMLQMRNGLEVSLAGVEDQGADSATDTAARASGSKVL